MKRGCVPLILLLGGVVSLARSGQTKTEKAPSEYEQTLMTAEKGFLDAAKKGEVAFFKNTLTDDFSFVVFDGRQDMIDHFAQGGVDIQPYEMKVVSARDGVGIVTYNVVLRVPPAEDQGPPPRYQHFTTVWGEAGRQLEDEISADDHGALGRLVSHPDHSADKCHRHELTNPVARAWLKRVS